MFHLKALAQEIWGRRESMAKNFNLGTGATYLCFVAAPYRGRVVNTQFAAGQLPAILSIIADKC